MPLILLLVANTLEKVLKNKINIKQIVLISYIVISAFTVCLYINKQDELIKKENRIKLISFFIDSYKFIK